MALIDWKILVGQICVTALAISCVVCEQNHGILYLALGGLLTSIGYPVVAEVYSKK